MISVLMAMVLTAQQARVLSRKAPAPVDTLYEKIEAEARKGKTHITVLGGCWDKYYVGNTKRFGYRLTPGETISESSLDIPQCIISWEK